MANTYPTHMEKTFDRRQRQFPSNAHRIAWYLGASMAPYAEVIPGGLSAQEARDLALGERSLYEFLCALYTDIWQHPTQYRMTESPDVYLNDGEWYKERPEMPKVRATNAHAIKALEVLFRMGQRAILDGDRLVLSAADHEAIYKEIRPKSISVPKVRGFLAALDKVGLGISGNAELTLRADGHPKMLVALKALGRHGRTGDSGIRFFAFQRCDFQAVQEAYDPDIALVLRVLPDEQRKLAEHVLTFLTESGYRAELHAGEYHSANWIVRFHGSRRYKASDFCWLGLSIEYLNRLFFEVHCMNPKYLIPIVTRKGSEYAEWFGSVWNQDCTGCGYCKTRFTEPGPYTFVYGDRKRGLCHQCWLRERNPTRERVESLLKMVALHTEAGLAA